MSTLLLTRAASLYAMRELLRRAGCSSEFIERCRVSFDDGGADLMPDGERDVRIRFPIAAVPAALEELFRPKTAEILECTADLLRTTLHTLSRAEEMEATTRDAHGRFPGSASLAHCNGSLQRPVIDEYGLDLQGALARLLPQWKPAPRRLRAKISHDIDLVGVPFRWKEAAGHLLRRGHPVAAIRDVTSVVTDTNPPYLQAVPEIVERSAARGLDSAIYWKASGGTAWDTGYDLREGKVRRMLEWADRKGIETGLHPGYYTFGEPAALQEEVRKIRSVVGERPMGGRQHFLRWTPETWLHWEQAGLSYDSTVGYADQAGFRAGTCIPYHPWLLSQDRESRLLEIPLIVMECTLLEYMKLSGSAAMDLVRVLIERCAAVGGVFTLLWHNSSLLERRYEAIYDRILDLLAGSARYDWQAETKPLPLPRVV